MNIWDVDHRIVIANRREAIEETDQEGGTADKDKGEDEGEEQVGILTIEVFLQGHLVIVFRSVVDPLPLSGHHGVEVGVARGGRSGRGWGLGRGGRALTQGQEPGERRTGEHSEHKHENEAAEDVDRIIIQHFSTRSHGDVEAKIRE